MDLASPAVSGTSVYANGLRHSVQPTYDEILKHFYTVPFDTAGRFNTHTRHVTHIL